MQFQSWLENRMVDREELKKEESREEGEGDELNNRMNVLQAQTPAIYNENSQNVAYDPDTAEGIMCEPFVQQWLSENKLLKLTQTFIENEVALVDLFDLASNPDDALAFCDEIDIKGLIKRRFIRALQKLPANHSTQNNQNEENINESRAPIKISSAEEKALKVIETSMNTNALEIDNLSQIQIPQLTQTLQQNTARIDSIFDEIISCAMDRKKELMQELKKKTHHKQQQVQMQISDLKERQKRLNQWHQRSQSVVIDLSLDSSQRKREILDLCTKALSTTASVTQSVANLNVKKQQTQIDAIKVKLMKVALIEDISNHKDDGAECKEAEIEKTSSVKPEPSIADHKSQNESLPKSPKRNLRKRRKKKNKASYAAKSEQNQSVLSPLSSVTHTTIVVQNAYKAPKDKKVIGDSWDSYPLQQNEVQSYRYKKELCTFYNKGKCLNGKTCKYAHGTKEQKKYNPYAKTRICPFVEAKQECPYMAQYGLCNHIHPKNSEK